MNRARVVRAILACEALSGELRRQLKADARAEFEEQECAPTWRFKGLATVSTSLTNDKAYVADEAAFLAYVREVYPTELEEIPATVRIRTAWLSAFLDAVAQRGDPPCDKDGRLVPGVEFKPGGDFYSVSIEGADAAKAELKAIAEEIAAGRRPLELPTAEDVTR